MKGLSGKEYVGHTRNIASYKCYTFFPDMLIYHCKNFFGKNNCFFGTRGSVDIFHYLKNGV